MAAEGRALEPEVIPAGAIPLFWFSITRHAAAVGHNADGQQGMPGKSNAWFLFVCGLGREPTRSSQRAMFYLFVCLQAGLEPTNHVLKQAFVGNRPNSNAIAKCLVRELL